LREERFQSEQMSESYTDADCLAALQDAADQLGQSPTQAAYRSVGMSPDIPTLTERFGSWNAAKRAAGLDICRYGRHLPWYHENADGYMEWVTDDQGTTYRVREHRLLAVAKFGFEAVVDMDVHHIDGHKFHNTLANIELLTKSEHGTRHVTMRRELVNHDLMEFF
jgi:hypothetical protein